MKDFTLALHSSDWVDFLTTYKRYNPSFSFELPLLHNKMIQYTYIASMWFIVNAFLKRETLDSRSNATEKNGFKNQYKIKV